MMKLFAGQTVPLRLSLTDGASGLFPQAKIYAADNGALLDTKDLSHVANGHYTNETYAYPAGEHAIHILYQTFSDSGHTTEVPFLYPRRWVTINLATEAVPGDAMDLVADAVDSTSIANGAITAAKFAANAITSTVLAADCITSTQIAANAISASEIANGAINSAKFSAGAITSTVLAADCIGANQIAANAIGASELALDAVNEIRDAILSDSTPFNGASIAAILAAISGLSIPTAAQNADAVWDEPISGHLSAGSTGEKLNDAASGAVDVSAIADAVLNELLGDHDIPGSLGQSLRELVSNRAINGGVSIVDELIGLVSSDSSVIGFVE